MKDYNELFSQLDKEIDELKQFDNDLSDVVSNMLKSLQKSKRIDNHSPLPPYKDIKKSPEYMEAVSSMVKTRLETKKALVKAYLDEINLVNRIKQGDDQDSLYQQLINTAKMLEKKEKKGD